MTKQRKMKWKPGVHLLIRIQRVQGLRSSCWLLVGIDGMEKKEDTVRGFPAGRSQKENGSHYFGLRAQGRKDRTDHKSHRLTLRASEKEGMEKKMEATVFKMHI